MAGLNEDVPPPDVGDDVGDRPSPRSFSSRLGRFSLYVVVGAIIILVVLTGVLMLIMLLYVGAFP